MKESLGDKIVRNRKEAVLEERIRLMELFVDLIKDTKDELKQLKEKEE